MTGSPRVGYGLPLAAAIVVVLFSVLLDDMPVDDAFISRTELATKLKDPEEASKKGWSTLWPNGIVKLVPAAARVTAPAAALPEREPLVLVPLLLGCLMLLRLWPRLAWLAPRRAGV